MNITDPFGKSYREHLSPFGIEIEYIAEGECGMGGPTQGVLKIEGVDEVRRALRCLSVDVGKALMVYLSWRATKGGAEVLVHMMDIKSKEIAQRSTAFGAYEIEAISEFCVKLVDSFSGRVEQVKFND